MVTTYQTGLSFRLVAINTLSGEELTTCLPTPPSENPSVLCGERSTKTGLTEKPLADDREDRNNPISSVDVDHRFLHTNMLKPLILCNKLLCMNDLFEMAAPYKTLSVL